MIDIDRPYVEFPYIRIRQPIGEFYVVSMPARFANRISYREERRRVQRDIAEYFGIERPLMPARVRDIAEFVRGRDATFPTAVILSIESYDDDRIIVEPNSLRIKNEPAIAEILDGQHRLAGLDAAGNPSFDIVCSIFVNLEIEDRARIFATINLQQRKVNPSLAYDLLAYAETRSPNKTLHEIIVQLSTLDDSPFYRRIKRLGKAEEAGQTLSQATFVNGLSPLLTSNDLRDRNLLLREEMPPRPSHLELLRMPFRNLWIDGRDGEIAALIYRYFGAAKEVWPQAWAGQWPHRTSVLVKTAGFLGLVRALPRVLESLRFDGSEVPSSEQFAQIFRRAGADDSRFDSGNIDPGTAGQNAIRDIILAGL